MKYLIKTVMIIMALSQISFSQLKEGDNLLGGSLGFWAKGDVPLFGVNFESNVVQAGIGTIGVGGIFRYYRFTNLYPDGDSRQYTFTSIGVQGNYNFNKIGNGKFVPFAGLVIGYNHVNNEFTNVTRNAIYYSDINYTSGAWLWAQTGFRYFFSRSVAGSVRLGLGNNDFSTLELGMDFRL